MALSSNSTLALSRQLISLTQNEIIELVLHRNKVTGSPSNSHKNSRSHLEKAFVHGNFFRDLKAPLTNDTEERIVRPYFLLDLDPSIPPSQATLDSLEPLLLDQVCQTHHVFVLIVSGPTVNYPITLP